LLDARGLWPDGAAYDAAARQLASRFAANFERFDGVEAAIAAAGPRSV
jgi:phosphoenolpyruvate carboxykinase (ATP)